MHTPVLSKEVIDYLKPEVGQKFIDGTVGDGGYVHQILEINPAAKVLGIDLDQTSLDKLSMQLAHKSLGQRVTLVHGNFRDIKHWAEEKNFSKVSGVILDLGFSSSQLDDPTRGLSFQARGPLDMRFNQSQKKTASDIVNGYQRSELAKVFREYGEEKLANKIASEIVEERRKKKIEDTHDLVAVIESALPKPVKHKVSDFARRIFQSLRIEVNDELASLRKVLPDILEILEPGGRMLIISFHSLEDRIVKEFFATSAKGCICPPDFPTCVCGKDPLLKILTKKPVVATEAELEQNSRSKPAKLRAAIKI
jgi:16S rRNA (cytosine1402-N4)-methyltransferase